MSEDLTYKNTGILNNGVCDCIYDAVFIVDKNSTLLRANVTKYFPEILAYKPKYKDTFDLWWKIDERGTRKRFKMVLDIISKLF